MTVHHGGALVDGVEFDNSYARGEPSSLGVSGVVKGWTEALPLMQVGSKWQLVLPPERAYGERQFGRTPPNSTLIFVIELLAVKESEHTKASKAGEAPAPSAARSPSGKRNK